MELIMGTQRDEAYRTALAMRGELELGPSLETIWFLLCRAAGGSAEPGAADASTQQQQQQQARPCLSLDYDQFTQAGLDARELVGPHVEAYFQPSTFLRLTRDARGAVPAPALFRYLCARSTLLRLRSELGALDRGGSGSLTPAELAAWLEGLAPEAALAEALVGAGDWAAAVGARLLLLHRRHGRLAIRELAASPAVHDLASTLEMLAGAGGQGGGGGAPGVGLPPLQLGPKAWASPAAVARLRARFDELDVDRDGRLSQAEFIGYSGGTMTQLFVSRLFAHYCCGRGGGAGGGGSCGAGAGSSAAGSAGPPGMGFAAFAAFVAAWEGRASSSPPVQAASLRYLFPLLDLRGAGVLSPLDLHTLFREVHALWVSMGQWAELRVEDVLTEVVDLVRPEDPEAITLADLQRCGAGGTVAGLLLDVQAFWLHENREALLSQQAAEADAADVAAGSNGGQ